MKKKDYFTAIDLYTQALDLFKQGKYLWTNRALAYLKYGKFKECEEDCTRILEYCEYLEDGFTKSRDPAFKGFVRRAQARLELKKYTESSEDIAQALQLFPEDKGALELKEFILKRKATDDELQKLEQNIAKYNGENFEDPKYLHIKAGMMVIDIFLDLKPHLNDPAKKQQIIDFNYGALLIALGKEMNEKDLMLYFYKKGGLDLIKLIMQKELYNPYTKEDRYNIFNFLHCILEDSDIYQVEAKDCGILRVAIKNLAKLADQTFKSTSVDIEQADKKDVQKENVEPSEGNEQKEKIDVDLNYKTMEE